MINRNEIVDNEHKVMDELWEGINNYRIKGRTVTEWADKFTDIFLLMFSVMCTVVICVCILLFSDLALEVLVQILSDLTFSGIFHMIAVVLAYASVIMFLIAMGAFRYSTLYLVTYIVMRIKQKKNEVSE